MSAPLPPLGPKPFLGYVDSPLTRASERRGDAAFLDGAAEHPAARTYLVAGELVVLRREAHGHDPLFTPRLAGLLGESFERVFLGLDGTAPRFGTLLATPAAEALKDERGFVVTDLRSIAVQGLVTPDHLAGIAEAKALLHWHARHRFCANCGAPTAVVQGGWRRDCAACGGEHFPRTDPVVIMLAIRGERCLLGRQSRFPAGMWSCLAGFVEPGESLEEAVRRETLEEAGIATGRVRYLASQPWPFPMSVMIGCLAEALSEDITIDATELEGARWVSRAEAAAMLTRSHPERLVCPPPIAIAHHLIRAFVEGEAA